MKLPLPRPRHTFRTALAFLSWDLIFGNLVHPLTVTPNAIQTALDKAPLVADIAVQNVGGEKHPRFAIAFRAAVSVERVIRNNGAERNLSVGDRIVISGPGGELQGLGVYLPGFARPRRGQHYRAYLRAGIDGKYEIAGFEKGLVPLTASRGFTRNRTDGSNGEGQGPFLFWDDTYFPIPYFISATTFAPFPDFISAIDKSFTTWRNAAETRFDFLAMGCTSVSMNENDGVNAVVLVQNDWPFDQAAIAITRNFYVAGASPRAGLILDSDILLNGVDHAFSTTLEAGKHDVQNIVTHEAGHFLGLGHETSDGDPDSTMYATATTDETKKRTLHADDIAGIQSAYPGAGQKNSAAPYTATCSLGPPGACLAVHDNARTASPRAFAAWVAAWLVGLFIAGRCYLREASAARPSAIT